MPEIDICIKYILFLTAFTRNCFEYSIKTDFTQMHKEPCN